MTRPLRERDVEDYLTRRVKAMGGEIRKVEWIGRRGAPDRLVMLPTTYTMDGRVDRFWHERSAWVELKAPGVRPEPHQSREHERMRLMGQRVEVIDSLAGVDRVLR